MQPLNIKLALGSDHAGYEMKQVIIKYLRDNKITFVDFGTYSNESTDYPDYAHKVAKTVNDGVFELGILICGSGNGVSMTANKYPNIRCALCWNDEIARLARLHNHANIIALPGRFISDELAIKAVEVFLKTDFEGGRHIKRVEKISQMKS